MTAGAFPGLFGKGWNVVGKMTSDEVMGFLRGPAYLGHLATVREDGRPHVASIWFIVDGEDIVFTTWHTSVKGKNLRRTGYAAMDVTDGVPPFTAVQVEGPVEIVDDLELLRHWTGIIGGRYMGADRAEEFARRNGVKGEVVCRMRPVTFSGIARITE
jgi:PPOX class probable F420-dependent enzyme